jgi:hypothetical protein
VSATPSIADFLKITQRADFVAKVQNCSPLIYSSETKVTAVADKYGAKLVSEVVSEFVTGAPKPQAIYFD